MRHKAVILLGATETFGQLLNRFDDKKDEIKIRGELSRLADEKERLLTELGRMVLAREGSSPQTSPYAEGLAAIQDIENQENAKNEELKRLLSVPPATQTQGATIPQVTCSHCGTTVAISVLCCPSCGDNLAEQKAQFKQCGQCGTYYSSDNRFCINDGCELVDLPVSQAQPEPDQTPQPQEEESLTCSSCGASIDAHDRFCGSCGARIA